MIGLARGFSLPVEIAGRRTAIFGISGSGKSNTATVILEDLIKHGEQVVLIDPKGEGWGLLSRRDGTPSNLDVVVFGEPNGHVELISEAHGPLLADFVFETGRSVVLSLLGLESDQSERRFTATFLRQLYRRKAKASKRTRILVAYEEAHLFMPESSGRGFKGDQAELSGAVQRMVRQGRTFGIGSLVIDQRPQDVAKRVISQCDTLICHQLTHKTDREALRDWVRGYDVDGKGDEFLGSLASLKPGEAWAWSPASKLFRRVQVRRRDTFDSGATPDGHASKVVRRAEVDLEGLRGQLASIVERAKADDPKELRKRIAELERTAKTKMVPTPAAKVERIEVSMLKPSDRSAIEAAIKRLDAVADKGTASAKAIEAAAQSLADRAREPVRHANELGGVLRRMLAKPEPAARHLEKPTRSTPPSTRHRREASGGSNGLGSAQRAMLTVLAQRGGRPLTRNQLAVFSGYSATSRHVDNTVSSLRSAGYIEGTSDALIVSGAGVEALGFFDPLPTGEKLRTYWLAQVATAEAAMLRVLIELYPDAIGRDELAEASGYSVTSRHVDNSISRLRTLELVRGDRNALCASAELFE